MAPSAMLTMLVIGRKLQQMGLVQFPHFALPMCAVEFWRVLELHRLTVVSYATGQSARNPIERCWSPVNNVLV